MVEGKGVVLRQYKGQGYAARVHIILNETNSASTIAVQLGDTNVPTPFSQGDIQKAYAPAYADWIQGAIIGTSYALAELKNSAYAVTITDILGLETDTNPTIVAAASIFAVWKAVNYHPPDDKIQLIEAKVLASWDLPFDAQPTF